MKYKDVVTQEPIIYGDFMTQNIDVRPYIEIVDHVKVMYNTIVSACIDECSLRWTCRTFKAMPPDNDLCNDTVDDATSTMEFNDCDDIVVG